MKKLAALTLALCLLAGSAPAGDLIRKACIKAGRFGATPAMCRCIQQVADVELKHRKDQKLAASFFKDPHKAQEIRQSDKRSNESFWGRYKLWGAAAEDNCDSANS